ncbi:hypothetical protein SAMN04487761_10310 [Lachnospiraceae bacterium C7]|nr:hypothetical protein SAMN04487761_10310 [Lachnospiraceae bacterium C7]
MSAQDNTEKVLKKLHVAISKGTVYEREPSKVIVDKQQMIELLKELNKCIYDIMDEYELTKAGRDRAEREFKKRSEEIVVDANHKAEDIYAASVLYTDEALNSIQDIMQRAQDSVSRVYKQMDEKLTEQKRIVKSNQLELKTQLEGLVDTDKYLKLIEERNREIEKARQLAASKKKVRKKRPTPSIYANRQTEIKVNPAYFEKLGMPMEEVKERYINNYGKNYATGFDKAYHGYDDEISEYNQEYEEGLNDFSGDEYVFEDNSDFKLEDFREEERAVLPQAQPDIKINRNSAYFKQKQAESQQLDREAEEAEKKSQLNKNEKENKNRIEITNDIRKTGIENIESEPNKTKVADKEEIKTQKQSKKATTKKINTNRRDEISSKSRKEKASEIAKRKSKELTERDRELKEAREARARRREEKRKRLQQPIESLDYDDDELKSDQGFDEYFMKQLKKEEEIANQSLASEIQKLMKNS